MEATQLFACLTALTLLTLSPGADTALVIRNSARGGAVDGFLSSLGICCGLYLHAILSALGISMLLLGTAWAFTLLKWAGGAYLFWLGLVNLREAFAKKDPEAAPAPHKIRLNPLRSLREGFFSNVLNPKPIIFYMAFLPQFIDPDHNTLIQSLAIASLHFTVGMLYQCGLAITVAKARKRFYSQGLRRFLQTVCGGFFIALGFRLVASR